MMKTNIDRHGDQGFTLIELMITVAIIAILAAVAYPSYMDSVRKAKRGEARAALLQLMQAEERYYTANNIYIDNTNVAFTSANGFKTYSGDNPATSAYSITATGASATSVTLTATANVADPKCQVMSIDSSGTKSSSPVNSGCW